MKINSVKIVKVIFNISNRAKRNFFTLMIMKIISKIQIQKILKSIKLSKNKNK